MSILLEMGRKFIGALPYAQTLSMCLEDIREDKAIISMPYDPRLIGDPKTGAIHGGAILALMDTAAGAAVLTHPIAPLSTATLDLRVDYYRPATPEQTIRAEAECYYVTHSIAFVRASSFDDDHNGPVAMATGAFTLTHTKRKANSDRY